MGFRCQRWHREMGGLQGGPGPGLQDWKLREERRKEHEGVSSGDHIPLQFLAILNMFAALV